MQGPLTTKTGSKWMMIVAMACPHRVAAAEFVNFLRFVLASLALALSAVPVWSADAKLFVPLDAAAAALFAPPSVAQAPSGGEQLRQEQAPPNGRLVRVDRRRLFQTIHAVERSGSGRLVLNVAEGLEFEVAADRTERTLSGHSLSGRVVGMATSAVTFAVHAEAVMGTVWTPGAAYEIVPLEGGVHVVREVDRSAVPRLGEPIRTEGGWGEFRPIEQANGDGGSVVDVLVLWTPRAMANTGSEARMRAGIDLVVAWANDAYARSGADVRLNLVGAEQVDYVEADGDSQMNLNRLENPSDGFMDEAHGRRDALGADLVSLFTGTGNFAGIANLPGPFSVVLFDADNAYWTGNTFTHELGHNMGLSHDRYIELGSGYQGLLPFSYGYVNKLAFEPGAAEDTCWITIMAYLYRCIDSGIESVVEVPYFSTPDQRYPDGEGVPLGVPKSSDEEGADGPADAVRSLNLTYPQVANFRSGRTDDGDTADAATPVVATSTTFAALAEHDDIDYFRIELPEAGWLRVETTGNGDPRGALTAEDGGLVAQDDDSGEGRNFLLEVKLEAGVYFIKVDAASGSFDYALVVSFNPASVADDHGDGAMEATAAAMPSSIAGELQSSSDTDTFRFEVAERGVVRVGTTGETDVVGTLVSADGPLRLVDDDSGPALNFLIAAKLDPGAYFVEVRGFPGSKTGAYLLDISFSPLSAEFDDHADSLHGATDLAIGSFASGELEVLLDQDHFRIEIPGAGPGQLWVKSTGKTDVKGALLRRDGSLMNDNRFGGDFPNFAVGMHVAPGTYFLRVDGGTTSAGPYTVEASFIADSRSIALFLSAANAMRQSFARIINRDDRPGTVNIHAFDDDGWRFGPVTLSLAAGQTAHFNSEDLETGNAAKGLSGGVGAGIGDWRLELDTDLDIEALAYVRTSDGFLTRMHEVATHKRPAYFEDMVATFNPAANRRQVSKLRLINPAPGVPAIVSNSSYNSGLGGLVRRAHMPATVSISGYDDRGQPSGHIVLDVPTSGASRTITAQTLEAGGGGLQGRLGDGVGKWRLALAAHLPVQVMSLLESSTGHLINLTSSTAHIGREASLPLFISASNPVQQSFVRIINRDDRPGTVNIRAIDDIGRRFGPVTLQLDAGQAAHFNSDDLEMGNAAKGLSGGVGVGEGDWRLELVADFGIQALAYVLSDDDLLTSMNALVPQSNGQHEVVIFNPASNDRQVSKLRLINPAAAAATITIGGVDDAGAAPPEGNITLTLPAGAAAAITAQQLEAGADHFRGRFGDGKGKWRLFIEADQTIKAMSLLESPTGHIANLSSGTAVR